MDKNKREKPVKEKRRNNEKRKEKSRDAARCRRSKETEIFSDLAKALPVVQDQISQLDKASIMRLAISFLRVRDMVKLVPEVSEVEEKMKISNEAVFLKSLEGFLLVLSPEGDFVYLSENVNEYLGITQIDLMGQNVFEYSHPCDHDEIREILSSRSKGESDAPKSFFIRLKCTLTSKGRSVNLKSATYKVIHCTGHILQITENIKKEEEGTMNSCLPRCLVTVGQPIPHPSNIEAPLPKQTFFTKHSLDMKFTHADDTILLDILGYNSEDLVGKSAYEYHHAMDSDSVCSAFKCLFSKGQCETNRYRFLAKTGGYVWVLTQATLIYDKMQKPQSVVCVNYIISGVECKDEIYSAAQLSSSAVVNKKKEKEVVAIEKTPPTVVVHDENDNKLDNVIEEPLVVVSPPSPILSSSPRPQTATSKIFAPRTEEMSKGFLTFSEEEPGLTMLKDEPDDLTHLAPVAGDVCVPLEDHPFLTDMLDDFFLRDNFCPLLTDEPSDPFISYRDSCDPSPQLLSPNLSKSSDCSLPPSLNSPGDSLGDEDQMSTFMNLQMEDDPDLSMKAPYIPMNNCDDLPLLVSQDIMWNNHANERNSKSSVTNNSSLAQLLCSSVNKQLKSDEGGGVLLSNKIMDDLYMDKNRTSWNVNTSKSPPQLTDRIDSSTNVNNKRSNPSSPYDTSMKRSRSEAKEPKMSSELFQQLMSKNSNRGRPKGKSNWLLDAGAQKAACISQPSDSVLMNLLNNETLKSPIIERDKKQNPKQPSAHLVYSTDRGRLDTIRKNSISLLDPEATAIPSLMDLTQQDYEVNAPVNNFLLNGVELLSALDTNTAPL